jgi:hypothetical protein
MHFTCRRVPQPLRARAVRAERALAQLALAPTLLNSAGMRRFLFIALLTACSSESEPVDPGADAGVAQVPEDLPSRTFVVDHLTVPTTPGEATLYGMDLDGDGAVDNKLGTVISTLKGLGIDATVAVSRAIDRGDTILLAKVRTTSFLDAPIATLETFAGTDPSIPPCSSTSDTVCRKHLEGGASFTQMPAPVGSPLTGRFDSGMFTGASGKLVVRIALLGADPIDVVLLGSRARLTMSSDSKLGEATLAGAVSAADIQSNVMPAVHANMSAAVADDCTTTTPPGCGCATNSDGKTAIALFDKTPADCSISLDEIVNSPLVQNLLEPDVMVDGQMALSLGVRASAVSAAFK